MCNNNSDSNREKNAFSIISTRWPFLYYFGSFFLVCVCVRNGCELYPKIRIWIDASNAHMYQSDCIIAKISRFHSILSFIWWIRREIEKTISRVRIPSLCMCLRVHVYFRFVFRYFYFYFRFDAKILNQSVEYSICRLSFTLSICVFFAW